MAQANSNPTTRRRFLSVAAAGSALSVATLAATTLPGQVSCAAGAATLPDTTLASPELRAAGRALADVNDRLMAAKAAFDKADLKMAEWTEANPEPEGRRPLKRWCRRWHKARNEILGDTWDKQVALETEFWNCQVAVANVESKDENDLMLKAALGCVYDKVSNASYGRDVAIISYAVAMDLFKVRPAAVQS